MSDSTQVWITATMIYDVDRAALHQHLYGGSGESVYTMRGGYPGGEWQASWPMVDLWARVPAGLRAQDAIAQARAKRGEHDACYDGTVGW